MNKKIASEIAIGLMLLVAVIYGGYFLILGNQQENVASKENIIVKKENADANANQQEIALESQKNQQAQEQQGEVIKNQENVNGVVKSGINSDENAVLVKGWKKLYSNSNLIFSTPDWSGFSYEKSGPSFSIEYPGEWVFNGYSVFYDKKGKKVAEFSPGLVILGSGQKCFDEYEEYGGPVLISREDIKINKMDGASITKKSREGGGDIYYIKSYCLNGNDKALTISLFKSSFDANDVNLHKKILSTIRFE